MSERDCATTWQTVGPFFSLGLDWLKLEQLVPQGAAGERLTFEGRMTDGDGQPVPDALLELWAPGFGGFGRVATDGDGRFRFVTLRPGPTPGPGGSQQAPHLAVSVLARGLMRRLVTRVYLPGEPANASDFALSLVPEARRGTLIARPAEREGGPLRWDVVLQGPGETVFFDVL